MPAAEAAGGNRSGEARPRTFSASSHTSLTPRQRCANTEAGYWKLVAGSRSLETRCGVIQLLVSSFQHRRSSCDWTNSPSAARRRSSPPRSSRQSYNHSQIEPEHLLLALLQQDDGVVPEVITPGRGAIPAGVVQSQLEAELARRPKVYGSNVQPGVSGRFHACSRTRRARPSAMRDDYVSTEHLLLALVGRRTAAARRNCWHGWASRATASWPASPRSAAASASPARTRRPPTRRWRSTAAT